MNPAMDQYFSVLKSGRPQIFGIYWSRPQVEARQAVSLARTRAFLNSLWIGRRGAEVYFDPERECTYADRVRRREPGDATLGLSPHMDAGSVERWIDPAYRRVYRHVFSGDWRAFDPFDGAWRTETEEIRRRPCAVCSAPTRAGPRSPRRDRVTARCNSSPSPPASLTCCSARFRTTSRKISSAAPSPAGRSRLAGNGTHHCSKVSARSRTSSPATPSGGTRTSSTPSRTRHLGRGHSSVMYIGAAPYCAKNAGFLGRQWAAFLKGESSPDFAPENYEVNYRGRATPDDLSDLGRRQMGLLGW